MGGVTWHQQGWANGGYAPVGGGEGARLLQLAMQTGTEASEQSEGKTLVWAGP